MIRSHDHHSAEHQGHSGQDAGRVGGRKRHPAEASLSLTMLRRNDFEAMLRLSIVSSLSYLQNSTTAKMSA
jgi:hypothetical protein